MCHAQVEGSQDAAPSPGASKRRRGAFIYLFVTAKTAAPKIIARNPSASRFGRSHYAYRGFYKINRSQNSA
jgi:hypothetical protein